MDSDVLRAGPRIASAIGQLSAVCQPLHGAGPLSGPHPRLGHAYNPSKLPSAPALLLSPVSVLSNLLSVLRRLLGLSVASIRSQLNVSIASVGPYLTKLVMGLVARPQMPKDYAYPDDIPGFRGPENVRWPRLYQPLPEREMWRELKDLAMPKSYNLSALKGMKADTLNFQPSPTTRTQDRYTVKELRVNGRVWTLTGVFDGHLGDANVEHVSHQLPIIVHEFLQTAYNNDPSRLWTPDFIAKLFSESIEAFDDAIANDVLELFGGIDGLQNYSDIEISRIINDQHRGGSNYKKARLCMGGTVVLIALVDPDHENLWVANLGDCQAMLVSPTKDKWDVEVLTTEHNGSNDDEIERLRRDHPEEPECVVNRRVLGALAPFRSLGDIPFKQPPEFSRRIIYNIAPGFNDISPWEAFLNRNRSPPYISVQPEVIHRKLKPRDHLSTPSYLVLASDGFTDICSSSPEGQSHIVSSWAQKLSEEESFAVDNGDASSNMALRLLWHALGGDDSRTVSKVLTLELDSAWIDDTSIIVQTLPS